MRQVAAFAHLQTLRPLIRSPHGGGFLRFGPCTRALGRGAVWHDRCDLGGGSACRGDDAGSRRRCRLAVALGPTIANRRFKAQLPGSKHLQC